MGTAGGVVDVDVDVPVRGRVEAARPAPSQSHAESHMQAIHRNNSARLLRFLRGLTPPGAPHFAEDLVQETMLRAWRNLDAVPTELESQRRWLFTVARRLAIDAYRKRQSRPVEVGPLDFEPVDFGADGSSTVVAKLTLRHAVGKLSIAHRSVLLELYMRGHSFDETAARLGVPVGTVKSRAHYAMQLLRNALTDDESGESAHGRTQGIRKIEV